MAARKVPDRCRPCLHLWLGGKQPWCTGHGMALKKADPHCRNSPAHNKFEDRESNALVAALRR